MSWGQKKPTGTGALGGAPAMNPPRPKMGPPGQNRIGAHPNLGNAKTGVKTGTPQPVKFKSRVGRKAF